MADNGGMPAGWALTQSATEAAQAAAVVRDLAEEAYLLERGTSGLHRAGGYVREEPLRELVGIQGVYKYKEMRDNNPVIGACLYATEMLMRKATRSIKPADDSLRCRAYADFVQGVLFEDLDLPWAMQLSEFTSMLPFGWSYHELVFKRRQGLHPEALPAGPGRLDGALGQAGSLLPPAAAPSRFDDGMIGLAKIAPRSQDTLLYWQFDQTGALAGMHQMDPWMGRHCYLPYEKCLLFRPTSYKDNPEGRSVLRTAYRSCYMLDHVSNIEAIGAERDLAGLPSIGTPPQWWSPNASEGELQQLDAIKRIGRNIRADEQACFVYPLHYDANGHPLFKFELLSSAGRRAFDTNEIIKRYELRIAQSVLADIIFLGHEAVGSFALASSKTNLFSMALAGYLRVIEDVINRRVIPLLWRLNALPEDCMPTLVHGDVESVDLKDVGQFIKDVSDAGFDVADLENHVRRLVEMPERDEAALAAAHDVRVQRARAMAQATEPHRPGPADPAEPAFAESAPQRRVDTRRRRLTKADRVYTQHVARRSYPVRKGSLVFPRAA
jgi:hypothetical protein